jgi:broad specificity phosphatase PhoE
MKVVLIPCGATEWHDEGRLLGRVELPLTEAGERACAAWCDQLKDLGLKRILHAPDDELAAQTAAVLVRRLGIPARTLDELKGVDVGLWAGLTEEQLKSRYPSAHHELCEAPLNVQPPGGEALSAAAERLTDAIHKMVSRNGAAAVGIVLRPLALVLAHGGLAGEASGDLLEVMRGVTGPIIMDVDAGSEKDVE